MRAEQEISDQVGAPPDAVAELLDQVLAVGSSKRTSELLPAQKRRVADYRVEAGPRRSDLSSLTFSTEAGSFPAARSSRISTRHWMLPGPPPSGR